MRPMIRRRTLACVIVFGSLSLVRADPTAVEARQPNPSGAVQALFDLGAPDPGPFSSDGQHGQREHPRFKFKVGHRVMRIVVLGLI